MEKVSLNLKWVTITTRETLFRLLGQLSRGSLGPTKSTIKCNSPSLESPAEYVDFDQFSQGISN